jgi:4'-phosphopantetheinyl transferase
MDRLAPDEVRIWTVELAAVSPEQLAVLRALLDAEERARASRKRIESDRRVFELAHGLLRHALSSVAPVNPAGWRFEVEPGGRPYVAGAEAELGLRFSLSHTHGLAACAVALERDVGVDAESLTRELDVDDLARGCLSDEERLAFASLDGARRREELLARFTMKEAYLKARGVGLALGLRSFAVSLDPPALLKPPPDDDASGWVFERHLPSPRHTLAVAARRRPDERLRLRYFDGLPAQEP